MNFQTVLEWVKANALIVLFSVLIVAAPIAMWFVASGMNAEVKKTVDERVKHVSKIQSLAKSDTTLPGQAEASTGVLTERFIEAYEHLSTGLQSDAQAVRTAAEEMNRKGRGVLLDGIFPTPREEPLAPQQFHPELVKAYEKLLRDVGAGSTPDPEVVRTEVINARTNFMVGTLQKDSSDTLTAEESKRLAEHLTNHRVEQYSKAAQRVLFYASPTELNVPSFEQEGHRYSMGQLFSWQWQYWINEDILRALAKCNQADRTVDRAPVKRVLWITAYDLPDAPAARGSGVEGGGLVMGAGGTAGATFGTQAPAETPPADDGSSVPVASADPSASSGRDFQFSITGRKSNPLYDVVRVEVGLIVEQERLPKVLDSLAKENFMTVTQLSLKPADSFAAASDGFIYGSAPVVEVQMELETIWLRSWTKPFMPESVRKELGVPADAPASTDSAAPDAAAGEPAPTG